MNPVYLPLSTAADKPLFTPGPLTTSRTVKQSMLRDLGSRDAEFLEVVSEVRSSLLALGGVSTATGHEAVLMQGSGTFGIEAVISSAIPRDGRLLVVVNGAYGERIAQMARVHGIDTHEVRFAEDEAADPDTVARELGRLGGVTHVAVVHCETTTGLFNPIEEIARRCRERQSRVIVDSMSAFGAVEVDLAASGFDFVISSSNKCIEGVPGFSFVLARREALLECEGRSRTLSLDLCAQWKGLERDGQFRFTPPTHAILAFAQALRELHDEGGVAGRRRRYEANRDVLVAGLLSQGFSLYLPREQAGHVITTWLSPRDPRFSFRAFYDALQERGLVIYPGKLTQRDCFRIGCIGRLQPRDMQQLVAAIAEVVAEQGFDPAA
jgi:2-aminoethylphosphonate-pyruvate transaminase